MSENQTVIPSCSKHCTVYEALQMYLLTEFSQPMQGLSSLLHSEGTEAWWGAVACPDPTEPDCSCLWSIKTQWSGIHISSLFCPRLSVLYWEFSKQKMCFKFRIRGNLLSFLPSCHLVFLLLLLPHYVLRVCSMPDPRDRVVGKTHTIPIIMKLPM